MGTKADPGDFDCYAKAEDNETMFVLLARDPSAPHVVRFWADAEEMQGGDADKIAEARRCADDMERWRAEHRPEPGANDEDASD